MIELFNDITISITAKFIELFRKNNKLRIYSLLILSLLLITFILIDSYGKNELSEEISNIAKIGIFVSSILIFFIIISFTEINIKEDSLKEEIDNIKLEREKIIKRISKKENNVIDTIQLSLNQITEYYTINLSQAKNSYRWSITAIIIGLITLVAGAWLIFFQRSPNLTVGIITGISGILIEFIGASNIYIYNKSLLQLNLYFKELINIQDTMLAIELCEKIDNSNPKKIEITESIILSLMGRSSTR